MQDRRRWPGDLLLLSHDGDGGGDDNFDCDCDGRDDADDESGLLSFLYFKSAIRRRRRTTRIMLTQRRR